MIASEGQVRGVGLQAKVYLSGAARAAVTSANLTARRVGGNHEFGCVSEESGFVAACASYFDTLWHAAGTDLDAARLDERQTQVDAFLNTGGRPTRQADLPDHGTELAKAFIGSADIAAPTEGWPAESDQAFVKFVDEGSNRVSWPHEALDEVQRPGCH